MFTKIKTTFALAVLGTTTLLAQPTLVEKVEPRADGLAIPYEKYKMPNGLTVLINEDHSDPVATVMVTYKVGSDRESIGKSGFAHFFEHMMFQGSKHVADEQHFKYVNEAGGNMNGNTTSDRTQYYQNIPSNTVEMAIWLESDRMGFLLDSLTSKKFENQRDAVKNEKSQNQLNRPYGMIGEIMGQTLYPYKHPYSWPVIGYVDDLDRANLQDVKNFFMRWYGPNNATLVVSGDVDTKQVLAWVEKYFNPLKQGPPVSRLKPQTFNLPSDKYASYRDKVYLPATVKTYPTVPFYHRDEPALIILGQMMGSGKNSIFYKNFVKNEKAAEAVAFNRSMELGGEFSIYVIAFPPEDAYTDPANAYEKHFKKTEESIKATIDEFEKTEITDEALTRIKASIEASFFSGFESTYSKAAALSDWDWQLGGRSYNLKDEVDRFSKVTKEDVVRVFNKYIKGAGAAVVNVYPRVSEKDSVKSFNPYAGSEMKDDPEYTNLAYTPPSDDAIWRKKPNALAPKIPVVPDFYTGQLKNGLKIIGTKTSETPIISMDFTIDGGNLVLTADELKKNGMAELTADMLNEGTKNYTSEKISAELEKLGSSVYFSAGKTTSSISVTCLRKNLDATLKLVEEKLLRPNFDEKDFKRLKKQFKENLTSEKQNPDYVASQTFSNVLYGNTIWGLNPTKKTIDKVELADVKNYYEKFYSPTVTKLVIVGDIDEKEIMPKLEFLNNWQAKDVKINATRAQVNTEPQVYVVDRIGASSSVMRIGHQSLPFDATGDYFKNQVANFVFGGNFNSRLNLNLREDKGYTYGIRSGFNGSKYGGTFAVSSSVKRRETGNSVAEVIKEMKNYIQNGVSDADVEYTKNSMLNSDALKYESIGDKVGFLYQVQEYGLSKDFPKQQAEILKNMTKADFNAQIKKAYDPSKMNMVLVGDKVAIKKQLDALNINMKEFNEKLNLKKVKELDFD